ncbi:MAG: hypothetical protein IT204_13245 [Fimbriimonadaceae bacterium]|nr:hypothetical protein [Fimbriimonadaceae bacterium]
MDAANPLALALQHALTAVGAVALAGSADEVTVGWQEFELNFAWDSLQAVLLGESPAAWSEAVAELVVETGAARRAADPDWDVWQPLIWPVVHGRRSAAALQQRCREAVAHPFGEVLLLTMAARFDGGLQYITRPQLEAWGNGGELLLQTALDNLRRQTELTTVQQMEPQHWALDGDDGFDSSRLLILDDLVPDLAECGALVAVPARDVLSFAPWNKAGLTRLRALLALAERCHRDWPYPIDSGLFYVGPQQTLHIGVSRDDDGTPRLRLPQELIDIQERLVREGNW